MGLSLNLVEHSAFNRTRLTPTVGSNPTEPTNINTYFKENISMKLKELIIENQEKMIKKYNITKVEDGCIGLDEEKGIWYGWSHRAVTGFKIGDKIFDENFGDDKTKFTEHGAKDIKTLEDAKQAAKNFAESVS